MASTYQVSTYFPQTRFDISPRVDVSLGEKNVLTMRYHVCEQLGEQRRDWEPDTADGGVQQQPAEQYCADERFGELQRELHQRDAVSSMSASIRRRRR